MKQLGAVVLCVRLGAIGCLSYAVVASFIQSCRTDDAIAGFFILLGVFFAMCIAYEVLTVLMENKQRHAASTAEDSSHQLSKDAVTPHLL